MTRRSGKSADLEPCIHGSRGASPTRKPGKTRSPYPKGEGDRGGEGATQRPVKQALRDRPFKVYQAVEHKILREILLVTARPRVCPVPVWPRKWLPEQHLERPGS